MTSTTLRRCHWLLMMAWLLLANAALAAPAINNVSVRGLQIGGTTTITIQGSGLSPEPKLIAPFPIAKQEVVAGATANALTLIVTLAGDVAPGIYPVRIGSAAGISPPLMLGVERLPQLPVAEQIAALPVSLTGAVAGGQIIKTSFAGKEGTPLVVDVAAQRMGANFKPVVRLYDSHGKQIAWSPPQHPLGGDARLAITLPADDTYTIELHDLLYRGGGPGFFHMNVGALSYADFTLPLGVTKGTRNDLRYTSTNVAPQQTASIDATSMAIAGARTITIPADMLFSGSLPNIVVSDYAEAVETPPAAGQQQLLAAVPSAISGVIAAKGEEDQYLVPVTAGQKLRIDVQARQLGSMLDGVLVIRNAQGGELARNDDQPGTEDPGLDFTVPANVDKLLVCVRDMEHRFGDAFVYRATIRDTAAPMISASIDSNTIEIPAGGTVVLPVNVMRGNYNGPLKITLEGAQGEIQLAGEVIPAGVNSTLLTLTAVSAAPVQSVGQLVVRATEANVNLACYALTPAANNASRHQPAWRHEVGVAIVAPAAINIAWKDAGNANVFVGDKLPLSLALTRAAGTAGNIRVRLQTTQVMPKKKIKENNQDKEVDDVDRALRLAEGMPTFTPEVADAAATLLIPGDLSQQPWTVVAIAELLSADGKNVLAAASTAARTFTPTAPFTLELTSTPQAEGKAGLGETGKFTGKITRAAGFTQPVTITLGGLPGEVKMVPSVVVPPDQTEFTLPLSFEYGSKAGDYKGLKLSASVADAKVASAAADVEVKIVVGEKPQ